MTLLIAVADARADRELVAAARSLAAAARWEVRAVHVREGGEPDVDSAELEGLDLIDLQGDAAAQLSSLLEHVDADAVAVGLRTTTTPGLGHVAAALLRDFPAPLLLVRPGMGPLRALRRIVVPLEGSPSASSAMIRADGLLCSRGREIVMLHVVTSVTPGEAGSMPAPRVVDQEHYEWADWREEFAMRFSQCQEGGRHRLSVRVGEPAPAIAEEATAVAAELIVLSWNGSFGGGRGAVVAALLESSPCPLLLVPSG